MRCAIILLTFLTLNCCLCHADEPDSAKNKFVANSARLPVSFEVNNGQADPAVQFLARSPGGSLLLSRGEAWVVLPGNRDETDCGRTLRLRLSGANPNPPAEGLETLPGKANYLLGNDASQWRTNITTFHRAKYHNVYPGIDVIYYGNQQTLEYDLIVQPGAKPDDIRLEFAGADKIQLDADGNLVIYVGENIVRQHAPMAYQEIDGNRKNVTGRFALHSGMKAGFELGAYDKSKALVIDPTLAYAATFGGSGLNQGLGIALDGYNNVYVTGITTSTDFPTTNGFQPGMLGSHSAFVVKFDTNGAVVYATYLGGGAVNDQTSTSTSGQGIVVDNNGCAFVTGYTTATNFPVTNAFQSVKSAVSFSGRNAFVTKLNPAGNGLVYSTYLGGSASDTATGITLDANGEATITGYTSSSNFPTASAAQPVYGGNGDAFVTRLNTNGNGLIFSTFLGGSSYENEDLSTSGNANPVGAVAVDVLGNTYVTGLTYSTNFPVLNAYQATNATSYPGAYSAAFVTKLDPAGNLVYSTYFGGRLGDFGRAIGVDEQGNVYFAGNSINGDLPVTNAYQTSFGGAGAGQIGDGFIAALDATGTNLMYCTYLGGSGDDEICGIDVRQEDGAVVVTGFTDSPNFPVSSAIQPSGFQGMFQSLDGASTWTLSNSGLTSSVIYSMVVDPTNPANVYALTKNGCFKSTNGGVAWNAANNGLGSISSPGSGSTASLLVMDPAHPATLYAAGFAGVFKTTNGAASWTSASTGLPSYPSIEALAVDPSNPATVYAGTYFNGLYKTTNGGAGWSAVNTGLTPQNIQAVVVDPNNSSNVYAGGGSYTSSISLYKSTNGGASWSVLGGGLQGGAVDLIAASGTQLYAVVGNSLSYPLGSNPSLKISTNGGLAWTNLLYANGLSFTALTIAPSASPALTISNSGNSEVFSWPGSFNGYLLQTTPALEPASWTTVQITPVAQNNNFVVTLPSSGAQGYFRLVQTNSSASGPPTLYLGTDQASGQGVLKSTDGGNSWYVTGPLGDTINALAVNPANPATVYAGLNGGRDAFLATLLTNGQLYASTYLGGNGLDQGTAVAATQTGAFVTGSTASVNFPTQKLAQPPAKLPPQPDQPSPSGGSPSQLKVLMSDGGYFVNQALMAYVKSNNLCPPDRTFDVVLHTGQKITNYYSGFNMFTGGAQIQGDLPPGITPFFADSGDRNITEVVLLGTAKSPGTNQVTIVYTDILTGCTWTYTIRFVVLAP